MKTAIASRPALLAFAVATLLLGACSKDPAVPPAPATAAPGTTPATAGSADPSLPDAGTVLSPAPPPARADASAGRTNNEMTRSQESAAMPLPGQNNDHSAPAAPARRASGASATGSSAP